ncbi:RNA-directed DNA polymerase, eukaryota [Tanacetum coccineum]
MNRESPQEDYVIRLSKSIFVTNFPENFGSSDLWKPCEAYGKVVDVLMFTFIIVSPKPVRGNHSNVSFASVPDTPSLVLDDSCVYARDLSQHVMGKVKDVSSIPNMLTLLTKEGFPRVKLTYLGGLWVMIELINKSVRNNMLLHTGVKSWFHVIQLATHDFVSDEQIVWVDIEGKVYLARVKELFAWTPSFLNYKEPEYVSDDEDTIFDDIHVSPANSGCQSSKKAREQKSKDLFGIYDLLNKHPKRVAHELDPSLSHPPGFTPKLPRQEDDFIDDGLDNDIVKENSPSVHSQAMNSFEEFHVNEVSKGHSESSCSHNHKGGSILELLDDMVRVGKSMGYEMEGCIKDIGHIIGVQGDDTVLK